MKNYSHISFSFINMISFSFFFLNIFKIADLKSLFTLFNIGVPQEQFLSIAYFLCLGNPFLFHVSKILLKTGHLKAIM